LAVSPLEEAFLEEARLYDVLEDARTDPKALIAEMRGFDPTLGESFSFEMFPPEGWVYESGGDHGWYWQADIVDWIMGQGKYSKSIFKKFLILKARQLGITWIAVAIGLWYILMRPGSNVVCYSHGEDEAKKLIARAWLMYQSLPVFLREATGARVVSPKVAEIPSEKIVLAFDTPEGVVYSQFQALPATQKAGHGDTVTFAIMDECSRMQYARAIYTAINPAVSRIGKLVKTLYGMFMSGGKLVIISTADGVSNAETGEGNYFHRLWATAKEKMISTRFLPWHMHPERGGMGIVGNGRDEDWYEREAMALDEVERNQQYPLNENDAFMLSGHTFFDTGALAWYREHAEPPLMVGQFLHRGKVGTWNAVPDGIIDIWEVPRTGGKYGISADVASGRSLDYSSCDVIDMDSGAIVAHLRAKRGGKLEIQQLSIQLKFLGRWYKDANGTPAMIMPERAGGWGEALIVALRSTDAGLDPYPNIYRHTKHTRTDRPVTEDYGFPMGEQTRGQILDSLKTAIRERVFPWLSPGHVDELGTFVYKDTKPSPRAQDGCNDDRVMSLALAWQLYKEHGNAPQKSERAKRWKKHSYRRHPSRQS
jgi:hypothetical protein